MSLYPKHPVPDADYLLRRAEMESRMAEQAKEGPAAEAHHTLAGAYLGKLFDDSPDDDMRARRGPSFDSRTAMMLTVTRALRREKPAVLGSSFDDLLSQLNRID